MGRLRDREEECRDLKRGTIIGDSVLTSILHDKNACVPWPHVRLMVRGTGFAGKTSTINAMAGKTFEPTVSTVGAKVLDLEMCTNNMVFGGGSGPLQESHMVEENSICQPAVAAYTASRLSGDYAEKPSMLDSARQQPQATSAAAVVTGSDSGPASTPVPLTNDLDEQTWVFDSTREAGVISKPGPSMIEQYRSRERQQNLMLRVQDTGGQPIFSQVIDLLSCPGGSVYMVVFSLKEMRVSRDLSTDQIVWHIEAIHAFASSAPLILVGTHRDALNKKQLTECSGQMEDALGKRCGAKVSGLVRTSVGSCFFAIENTHGFQGDDSIKQLVQAVGSSAKKIPSVKKTVPLKWLRLYEELLLSKKRCVGLQHVRVIAMKCGMPHEGHTIDMELHEMLKFFHSLNVVLWFDTPSLRNLVILDVQWVIDACSCFIRVFNLPDHQEGFKKLDEIAKREVPEAFQALKNSSIVQTELLDVFWARDEFKSHRESLLSLLTNFGLFVPVLVSPDDNETEYKYFVPALMQDLPSELDDKRTRLRLHFTMKEQCEAPERSNKEERSREVVYPENTLRDGFFPLGAFHGLCAGLIGSCPGRHELHRNSASVWFDNDCVTLTFRPKSSKSCVMVDFGESCKEGLGALVVDRLRVILAQNLKSIYENLQCKMLARYPDCGTKWVDIDALPQDAKRTLSKHELDELNMLQKKLVDWYTSSCTFSFIRAQELRESSTATFPRLLTLQQMKIKFPGWLKEENIQMDKACRGGYKERILAVSHRWEDPDDCDPKGVQLDALREFLRNNLYITLVFFDFMCMYQGSNKTPGQKATFGVQLPNINLLYLGASVLIMLDSEYTFRFWTQFEAWLSMQHATEGGLVSVSEEDRRYSIVCINRTPDSKKEELVKLWSNCDANKARDILMGERVKVTNQSDKEVQVHKIASLDWRVKCVVSGHQGAGGTLGNT
uniref:COR domain-containing protein n=1 Tax=Noctiluca scintillans TaxID=2966 RepID=A0A7S1ABL7_NOCSC|mmetsp:Transcript_3974/g.11070  ORF Transcript_3974/g.11070 Transcript_3974/m.11070 type:complete len:950 (+) Transcript_3974:78-2927(+)